MQSQENHNDETKKLQIKTSDTRLAINKCLQRPTAYLHPKDK